MNSKDLLKRITQAANDLKALELVEVDLIEKSTIADYLVICHGTSITHLKGISDRIEMDLKKNNILPLGIEGREGGEWILMDYNDVIVHLFLEEVRRQYQLEDLYQGIDKEREE